MVESVNVAMTDGDDGDDGAAHQTEDQAKGAKARGGRVRGGRGIGGRGGGFSIFPRGQLKGRTCSYCKKENHIDHVCRAYQRDLMAGKLNPANYKPHDAVGAKKKSKESQPTDDNRVPIAKAFKKTSEYSMICLDAPTVLHTCVLTTRDCFGSSTPPSPCLDWYVQDENWSDRFAHWRPSRSDQPRLRALTHSLMLSAVPLDSNLIRVLVDSGATRHMFSDRTVFVHLDDTIDGSVALGAPDISLPIRGIGDTHLDVVRCANV